MRTVSKAFAPASISNLACGYDILGLALEAMGDEVIARISEKPGVRIKSIKGHSHGILKDVNANTAGKAVEEYLQFRQLKSHGIELEIIKNIPLGSGLGGSAASAVAAVVATDRLMKTPLEKRDLLPFVLSGERVVHPNLPADNVSASLLGGICMTQSLDPLMIHRIPIPTGIHIVVLLPDIQVLTAENRSKLKKEVRLKDHIRQSAQLGSFVLGCIRGNWDIIQFALKDFIIEPQRAQSIPHFYELQKTALDHGALGCSISGSGPAIFAFCMNSADAGNVEVALKGICADKSIEAKSFISGVSYNGAFCY